MHNLIHKSSSNGNAFLDDKIKLLQIIMIILVSQSTIIEYWITSPSIDFFAEIITSIELKST